MHLPSLIYTNYRLKVWEKATNNDQLKLIQNKIKKSHTCEEGGEHIKISVWHLLMSLNSNYLLKNLLQWANKWAIKNFNIYHVVSFYISFFFFFFLPFCPFTPPHPPKNPKNHNFEKIKIKNIAGDIIILHMCTNNHNHMR